MQLFGATEAAMGVDGPLRRVLYNGHFENMAGKNAESMARGAFYELERGLFVEAESNVMNFEVNII